MSAETMHPRISVIRGILMGTLDQYAPDQPDKVWQLRDESSSSIDCLIPSAELLHSLLSQPITTLNLQLAHWPVDHDAQARPLPILTGASTDERPDYVLYHLPLDICPVEGTYMGILELIETIDTPPLCRMLWRIFREREIVARYWTMPASARHHHAFPGGLAVHSLEVARDLAGQAGRGWPRTRPVRRRRAAARHRQGVVLHTGHVPQRSRTRNGARARGPVAARAGVEDPRRRMAGRRLRHAGVAQRLWPHAAGWLDAVGPRCQAKGGRPAQLRVGAQWPGSCAGMEAGQVAAASAVRQRSRDFGTGLTNGLFPHP